VSIKKKLVSLATKYEPDRRKKGIVPKKIAISTLVTTDECNTFFPKKFI